MTLFEILKTDHKKVGLLLKQIEKTKPAQLARRKALFSKLEEELTLHSKSEEKAVYAPLRLKDESHDLVMESYEEHGLAEHLVDQVLELSPGEDTWTAKMTLLTELVRSHVEQEETVLFKKMKTICTSGELAQMATDFKNIKKEKSEYSLNKKMKMNHVELRA